MSVEEHQKKLLAEIKQTVY